MPNFSTAKSNKKEPFYGRYFPSYPSFIVDFHKLVVGLMFILQTFFLILKDTKCRYILSLNFVFFLSWKKYLTKKNENLN